MSNNVYKLTAQGRVAPADQGALLSTVAGKGGENVAVTCLLGVAGANLRETQAEVGFPLYRVVTRLQKGQKVEVKVRKRQKGIERLRVMYLEDRAVDDGAERLRILFSLSVGGAGVGGGSLGQRAMPPCELLSKRGHTVFHVPLRRGEVIMLVPGECSAQSAHLQRNINTKPFRPQFMVCFVILETIVLKEAPCVQNQAAG